MVRLLERLRTSERTEKGCPLSSLSISIPLSSLLPLASNAQLRDSASCHRAIHPDSSCFSSIDRERRGRKNCVRPPSGSGPVFNADELPNTKSTSIYFRHSNRHGRTSWLLKCYYCCRPLGVQAFSSVCLWGRTCLGFACSAWLVCTVDSSHFTLSKGSASEAF